MKRYPDETEQARRPSPAEQVEGLGLFQPADARAEGLSREAEHELHARLILEAYERLGPMTADDAGAAVGLQPLQCRPRVTDLAGKKYNYQLRPSGKRGTSAYGNSAAIMEINPGRGVFR